MTNSKDTKRAFLGSIFSMIVCLAMLIGSTFAWFTDSVVSGKNQIVAGNLDVELLHSNAVETDQTVEGETDLFVDKDGNSVKWEPGVMTYENFTVKNEGSLAIKYQFKLNIGDVNTINVDETKKSLKDVLKVAIIDRHIDLASRDEILGDDTIGFKTMSAMKDADYIKNSTLTTDDRVKEGKKYCVIIFWEPSDNDDAYNLNNVNVSSDGKPLFINIGVSLVATQYNTEKDSFGDDYDKGLVPSINGLDQVTSDGSKIHYADDGEVILKSTQNVKVNEQGIYNVPKGVTTIDSYAFSHNTNIKEIILPSTVKTIANNAFKNTSATNIVLNNGLTTIGDYAFDNAIHLKTINIPPTLTSIGGHAFRYSGVVNLTIPESVQTIGRLAFYSMPDLNTLTIDGNSTIDYQVARSCPNLENVYLNGDNMIFFGADRTFTRNEYDASEIKIYVKNDDMKNRVKAAQGNARNYTIVLPGE